MNGRLIALLALVFCSPTVKADAGIGPENVIVVVNADSTRSRSVANHYVTIRDIPESNVILLRDIPAGLQIGLEDFKSKILKPVLETIDARKVAAQTRVIAYSADF